MILRYKKRGVIVDISYLPKFLIIFLLTFSMHIGFGQDNSSAEQPKVLFKDADANGLRLSTFFAEISPRTAFFTIGDKTTSFVQLELGIHLNRKYVIGYYLASSPKTTLITVPTAGTPEYQKWLDSGVRLDQLPSGQDNAYVYFHHNGLNLGYMYKAHKVLFPRSGVNLGRGILEMTGEQKSLFQFFRTPLLREKIWNVKPEIGLGVNLRPWWRIYLDFGYQFVIDEDIEIIQSGNFDGATMELAFSFGAFSR